MTESLTTTSLLASVTERLLKSGYSRIRESKLEAFGLVDARGFEDPYGIVVVVAWKTCEALLREWTRAQSVLIELISAHYSRSDSKAWDGYVVLLTAAEPSSEQTRALDLLRYNTAHARKIVATGDELRTISDVEWVVATLLPLKVGNGVAQPSSVLEQLPDIIADDNVPRYIVEDVVAAHAAGRPLMEAIHRHSET